MSAAAAAAATAGVTPMSPAATNLTAGHGVDHPKAPDPHGLRVARELEAVFLRKMLSALEKASHVGGATDQGSLSSGGDMYGSLVVGAMADAVAAAGGIGLAPMILSALGQSTQVSSTPAVQKIDNSGGASGPRDVGAVREPVRERDDP